MINFECLNLNEDNSENKVKPKVVVRLTTSSYYTKDGFFQKKSLKYLKRKCVEFNVIKDDCEMVGAEIVFEKIVNLYEVKDGIYEVLLIHPSTDWETGTIEDWDYKLSPFKE